MGRSGREAWLNHPRIKAAAKKQLGEDLVKPRPRNAYARVESAIAKQWDWTEDSLRLDESAWRLEWEFVGVDLLGTNTLLRCHQAKVVAYREQWKKRTSALIYQNQQSINSWHRLIEYPIRYEVAYMTPHNVILDEDNLIGGAKVVLDEIVRQTPIPDDSSKFVRYPLVETHRTDLSKLMLVMYPIMQSPLSAETERWIREHLSR